jgi:transketolase N-terminal domain/subunit
MNKAQIITDLKQRQKALSDQLEDIQDDGNDDEGSTWESEVDASLQLVEELLSLYTKKSKKKRKR